MGGVGTTDPRATTATRATHASNDGPESTWSADVTESHPLPGGEDV